MNRRTDIMRSADKAPDPLHLERTKELEAICSVYEKVAVQRGHVVLLTGPAGVGKSALAEAVAREAKARGALLLDATCRRNDPPGGPLQTLLRHAAVFADAPRSAPSKGRLDVNRLLAELTHPGSKPSNLYNALFESLVSLLENLAIEAPVVLVLDDLHQADDTTREVLSRLASRLAPVEERITASPFRGLILLATRGPRDLPGLWLEGMSHSIVSLGNLDETALSGLLNREDTVRRLVELTGGHPSRLRSLLAWGTADPQTALSQAMASLSHHSRDVLACCAVAGGPVGLSELARQTGLETRPLGDAVQALLESGLVEYSLQEGELHIEVESKILTSLMATFSSSVRNRWHQKWAASFKARGDAVRAAEHALAGHAAAESIDEILDPVLAAHQMLTSSKALDRAASLCLTTFARLGPRLANHIQNDRVVTLLLATMDLLERQGRFDEALDSLSDLAGLSQDPRVHWRLGRILLLAGRPQEARMELAHAARDARLERELWARIMVDMGEAALAMGETAEARTMAERVREKLATLPECHEVAASERILMGKVLLSTSSWEAANETLSEAIASAHRSNHGEPLIRALITKGIAALRSGDMDEARSLYAQALELASRDKSYRLEAYCQQNLGVLAHWGRDYKAALHWFHEAARTLSRIGNRAVAAWVAVDIGDLYLELGAVELANKMVAKAAELLEGQNAPVAQLYHTILQARLNAEDGLVLKAKRLLMQAGHMAKALGRRDDEATAGIELARTEHRLGDRAAAAEVLSAISEPAGKKVLARYLMTKGEILGNSDLDEAERLFRRALVDFQDAGDLDGAWKAMARLSSIALASGRNAQAERWRRSARRLESRIRKTVPEAYADSYLRASFRAEYLDLVDPMKEARPSLQSAEHDTQATPRTALDRMVGRHPTFRKALAALERIAATDSTVLLLGESGTGKELAAEAIHEMSNRRDQPLVKVNCAALVDTLLLSELFGHERGAFTGAVRQKKGRFETADGGTLFLDEIGDISARTQVALLRVLQEKTFERVGGVEPIHVDVRIVCATNRNLEELVEQGLFREDLYYRLKGIQVTLPALRDRSDDVPLLADEILGKLSRETDMPPKHLSPDAMALLQQHHWPGNVRELQNVLRSAWVFSDGPGIDAATIQPFLSRGRHSETVASPPSNIPDAPKPRSRAQEPRQPGMAESTGKTEHLYDLTYEAVVSGGLSLKALKKSIERECIVRAISQTKGNITKAAALLGMKRPRLSQLVKEYGLTKSGRYQMEDENHD